MKIIIDDFIDFDIDWKAVAAISLAAALISIV